jgi:hypothetical protein
VLIPPRYVADLQSMTSDSNNKTGDDSMELSMHSTGGGPAPAFHSTLNKQARTRMGSGQVSNEAQSHDSDRKALEKLVSDLTLSVPVVLIMVLYCPVGHNFVHNQLWKKKLANADLPLGRLREGSASSTAARLVGIGVNLVTIYLSGRSSCSITSSLGSSSSIAGGDQVAMVPTLTIMLGPIFARHMRHATSHQMFGMFPRKSLLVKSDLLDSHSPLMSST